MPERKGTTMLQSKSMRLLRTIAAVVLSLTMFCLCACSAEIAGEPGCLFLNGENVAVDWVLKINGKEISADTYRYQFLTMRDENDEGDASFWTDENAAILKEQVTEFVALLVTVEEFAADYGFVRGTESAAYAEQEYRITQAGFGSEEEFLTALAELHMNANSYRYQLESDYLQMQLYSALFEEGGKYAVSNEKFVEIVQNDYARVRYLAINYDDTNYAQKREHAENLAQMATDENFVELVNQYSEEKGMVENPDGLYLRAGMTTDTVFESACFALAENEISGLIETDRAFYVIKRLAPEAEYIEQNIEEMISDYYGSIFSKLLLDAAKDYTVEYAEIFDEISVWTMG